MAVTQKPLIQTSAVPTAYSSPAPYVTPSARFTRISSAIVFNPTGGAITLGAAIGETSATPLLTKSIAPGASVILAELIGQVLAPNEGLFLQGSSAGLVARVSGQEQS